MTRRRQHARDGERGSILISGLLLSLAVLMILGAVVDLGHAFIERRDLTVIADDAALAGSQALNQTAIHHGDLRLDPLLARREALATITRDKRTTASADADTREVNVSVTRRVPTILLGLVGMRTLTISASSTAEPRRP